MSARLQKTRFVAQASVRRGVVETAAARCRPAPAWDERRRPSGPRVHFASKTAARLRRRAGRCGTTASVSDDFRAVFVFSSDEPLAVDANAVLRAEWEARWPKRPRWLARRLHGEGALQI